MFCGNEHEIAIRKEVERLTKRGYNCKREYIIILGTGKRKRLEIDIRATRGSEELLIEIGTLSKTHVSGLFDSRLEFIKQVCPNAKIIHITQWKNWINQFDWIEAEQKYRDNIYLLKTF